MKFELLKVEDFYETDYVDAASYDNLRKIASYVDGLKNASRKVVHTVLDKNINKKTKVENLQSTIAQYTEYLHGPQNLSNVIVNLAQDFTGTNNIPLLQRNGEFGSRHDQVSAASRYIYTQKEKYLDNIFNKNDRDILVSQNFEGVDIEPRFFVPIIPLLLINGSGGGVSSNVSSGFAQNILPRNPKTVISELKKILKGVKKLENVKLGDPFWNGFKGDIIQDDEISNKWYINGSLEVENTSTLNISEVPIGYDLKKYIDVLDNLDDNNIVVSYKDKSENDLFDFKVKVKREFTSKNDLAKMKHKYFKIVKPVTENYTCIDERNRIQVFNNVEEIFIEYYKIRMDYYSKRKVYQLDKLEQDLSVLNSKYLFIDNVIKGNIVINNKSKASIIKDIEKNDKIIKVDSTYEYLLRMPIYSLSKEKMTEIKNKIKDIKETIKVLKSTTESELWLSDLDEYEKSFK